MRSKLNSAILLLGGLNIVLALIALLVNYFIFQFPGNNYFPPNSLQMGLSLILFYPGSKLLLGKNHYFSRIGLELIYFFLVMCIMTLTTNAVQNTPFSPIDHYIMSLEHYFKISIPALLCWTHNHPKVHLFLGFIYDSLTNQMCIIPLCIIALRRIHLIRDYYFLLLFTTLIGFSFYYFYPTLAPASVIDSDLFTPYQIATSLKFNEIHQHKIPSTIEGGLIAFPSFHTIWALFCVYLLKEWPIACFILCIFNILLISSCVLLGWHYPSDILAGFVLVYLAFLVLHSLKKSDLKKTC